MKKTWDEKFNEWWVRSKYSYRGGMRPAYEAGRKHQRKVCNENTVRLKAFLRHALESSDALTVKSNRLEAENKALKMENKAFKTNNHRLVIFNNEMCSDLSKEGKYRHRLTTEILNLEARLAPKWWQFWRKA